MMNKHRISTNIGKDQFVNVELKQEFDLLEILSMKITQKDVYTSYCADYGVVCGRVSVNNGLGVKNARVSIFIPLSVEDENDPVISTLYPYKAINDKNEENYRYNLLPARKQHGGHEPTGTFPDQTDVLNREEVLEVYEKYYKFTVKTNDAGDFMIWGVPVGSQTLHIDIDLSDIGEYSLRPYDFIRGGLGIDNFKNTYSFKSSEDLDSLPQIISYDKTIEVYPFWGNKDLCEISISRSDFDLSDRGIYIEPKAFVLGSIFTDSGKNSVNKNCRIKEDMGKKCNLITTTGKIEAIRYTTNKDVNNRPVLEEYRIDEDIDDDGSFVLPLPMNMDYVYTNEFGDLTPTNDTNKGIPTSACYRLRVSIDNNESGRVRNVGTYLVPNIREYNSTIDEIEKSYAWSTDWVDYPTLALSDDILFNNIDGKYYPQDYFYRFTGNKVYSVSSFISSYFSTGLFSADNYLGIKDISPKIEDDCDSNVQTPPINFGSLNYNFSTLLTVVINTLERIVLTAFVLIVQVLIWPFQTLYSLKLPIVGRPFRFLDKVIEWLQDFGTLTLSIVPYSFCEKCEEPLLVQAIPPADGDESNAKLLYQRVLSGTSENISVNYPGLNDGSDDLQYLLQITTTTGYTDGVDDPLAYQYNSFTLENATGFTSNYIIEFIANEGLSTQASIETTLVMNVTPSGGNTYFIYKDSVNAIADPVTTEFLNANTGNTLTYAIYDSTQELTGVTQTTLDGTSQNECKNYNTVFDESIVSESYCTTLDDIEYYQYTTGATKVTGYSCNTGRVVGQILYDNNRNNCKKCVTHSGFSEFVNGVFYVIPAASASNWDVNRKAIAEYSRRKLIGKLFCGGIVNYSFIDNWLHGSLYFYQFKAKVRWDNYNEYDLNYGRTKYCDDLVYYKVPDRRFYYRSTYTLSGSTFENHNNSLGYPTTFMDLGVRDEFIKEISINKDLDLNSSVIRSIGATSYQDHKDILSLYLNYFMDDNNNVGYKEFFSNNGFNSSTKVLNGDILQLISINNEAGIEGFDLSSRYYGAYNPRYLDVDDYPALFSGNTIPINMILDDGDGYNIRENINNPNQNSINSSQIVPFYLWKKNGSGFGSGLNHSWDYTNVQAMKLQNMSYGYSFTGNPEHKYILFPMTNSFSGLTLSDVDSTIVDTVANIESTTNNYTDYNNEEEGFTFLHITSGSTLTPLGGTLYTRVGDVGNWDNIPWTHNIDFIIKPTEINYNTNEQILSTPFLFYFGLKSGKSAAEKFINLFGPKGAFPSAE